MTRLRYLGLWLILLLLVGGAFGAGLYLGYNHRPVGETIATRVDFSAFWQAWQLIDQHYVPETVATTTSASTSTPTLDQKRVWGAISGMIEALGDPYSQFFPPAERQAFEDDVRGDFGGIGVELGARNGTPVVIAPLANSPAERAGVHAGDKILAINHQTTAALTLDTVVRKIRGERGTTVVLTLSREGQKQPLEISVVRETIVVPTIVTKKLPEGVYLIKLFNFSGQASNAFRGALRSFVSDGQTTKLILDLRGNPGGYLEAAIDIASWFLPASQVVVREWRGPGNEKVYRSYGYDIFNHDQLKMVILIDGGSASASEIVAGALAENGVATLIGTKTFGKGSVQELIPLTADTSIKLTIARWLTPTGRSISHDGLTPTIEVKATTTDPQSDPVLRRAVAYLINGK